MTEHKKLRSLFYLACLMNTIALFCYCGWRFIQNESNALVDFRSFHQEEKDVYPSFSICLDSKWNWSRSLEPGSSGIYNATNLKSIYGIDEANDYVHYLQGRFWNESMSKLNYDDVTVKLEDHMYLFRISLNAVNAVPSFLWLHKEMKNYSAPYHERISFPFYVSLRTPLQKCFTVDFVSDQFAGIKDRMISYVEFETKNWKYIDVYARFYIHYPNQLLRAIQLDYEYGGSGLVSGKLESKVIWIHNIEVIRRRNTFKTPCNENSLKDMDLMDLKLLKQIQCKPPHWIDVDFPICNNSQKIKKFDIGSDIPDSNFLKLHDKPCDQVQSASIFIQENYRSENNTNPDGMSSFGIMFNSPDYREIKHTRDFNLESLIGNVGGYIGLFLGFAFWQIPDALGIIFDKLSQRSQN